MAMRNVISTLNSDGTEVMGPGILMYHYPGNDIMNGSLLTVESNHFCVLKSRGAILNVYETGQYPVETPQRPLSAACSRRSTAASRPGSTRRCSSPAPRAWSRRKGLALSRELAEMVYDVDYYVHVDSPQDAVKLVTHMPYSGHILTADALNAYAGPVVEQSVNQLVQLTPLEQVNERIHEITELVRGHLQDFLSDLRRHAQRREGADPAERRADARADLAARVRPVGDRRGPLLRRDEDGRAWPRLRAEHGRRPAVQHRAHRHAARPTSPGCNGVANGTAPRTGQ